MRATVEGTEFIDFQAGDSLMPCPFAMGREEEPSRETSMIFIKRETSAECRRHGARSVEQPSFIDNAFDCNMDGEQKEPLEIPQKMTVKQGAPILQRIHREGDFWSRHSSLFGHLSGVVAVRHQGNMHRGASARGHGNAKEPQQYENKWDRVQIVPENCDIFELYLEKFIVDQGLGISNRRISGSGHFQIIGGGGGGVCSRQCSCLQQARTDGHFLLEGPRDALDGVVA